MKISSVFFNLSFIIIIIGDLAGIESRLSEIYLSITRASGKLYIIEVIIIKRNHNLPYPKHKRRLCYKSVKLTHLHITKLCVTKTYAYLLHLSKSVRQ